MSHRVLVLVLLFVLLVSGCAKIVVSIDGKPYVIEVNPFSDVTATPTIEFFPTVTPVPTCVVSTTVPDYVNVRDEPRGNIVGQFPGDSFSVVGQYYDGLQWWMFVWDDLSVWVAGVNAIYTTGDCSGVPSLVPFL